LPPLFATKWFGKHQKASAAFVGKGKGRHAPILAWTTEMVRDPMSVLSVSVRACVASSGRVYLPLVFQGGGPSLAFQGGGPSRTSSSPAFLKPQSLLLRL
jgi:hypothetical protein